MAGGARFVATMVWNCSALQPIAWAHFGAQLTRAARMLPARGAGQAKWNGNRTVGRGSARSWAAGVAPELAPPISFSSLLRLFAD